MTQPQFELIVKIISNGAPALANELNNSLNDLVIDRNNLASENEELKEQLTELHNIVKDINTNKEEANIEG